MLRAGPTLLRGGAGVALLWFLWRLVGAEPFRKGLHSVTWQAVVAAGTLTAVTTVCSAWRWRVIARALGAEIDLGAAVGAYYRSLFLNSALPGGSLGDVHRGVVHGRRTGGVMVGLRAVGWERLCGQVMQVATCAAVVVAVRSPFRPAPPTVLVCLAGLATVAGGAALGLRAAVRRGPSRSSRGAVRAVQVVRADVQHILRVRGVWPRVLGVSLVIVAGHTATFVVAARVGGSAVPLGELVALLLVVQCATVVPLSLGGWGLREGVAAWAFATAGWGAATGITVSILYAVLMLVAVAPGAVLLLNDAVGGVLARRRRDAVLRRVAVHPGPLTLSRPE